MKTTITDDIRAIGVDDHAIDLFEGQFAVPQGMSYNSYVVLDEKVAVLDTVDARFGQEWLDRLQAALAGRRPDYLVVQHMEPDHSANVAAFMDLFPEATVVASAKAFAMMGSFFGRQWESRRRVVEEGDTLELGRHVLAFLGAPMVHWPEVVVTYDTTDKVLFSADAFGTFGAQDVAAAGGWAEEARRYYFGIVGKYGAPVRKLLEKAAGVELRTVCPLHGPVLEGAALRQALELYGKWAAYEPESAGALVAYTSVYGHTKAVAELLADRLRAKGCPEVVVRDLARCDVHEAIAQAFRLGTLALATTTYNGDVFPAMRGFVEGLAERGFRDRAVGLVENGSWAPMAAKAMAGLLEKSVGLRMAGTVVHVRSALSAESRRELEALADELCAGFGAEAARASDPAALFRIGYGLYVATVRGADGRDGGCILNTVCQVTNAPNRVAVAINKLNYTHHVVQATGRLNLCCLSEAAPFDVFRRFGFQTGRTADKFAEGAPARAGNGLAVLPEGISNAFLSLKVESEVDLGTHGMFVCSVEESQVLSPVPTMTYAFYQANVKPKPAPAAAPAAEASASAAPGAKRKRRWVCKICGYVYEGEELPPDFVCPLCKHGAEDFELVEE